jgi:signal transduction histidine kinase/CheY-like chemotaxis protein
MGQDAQKYVPGTTSERRLEEFRIYMNELQSAKRLNDDSAMMSCYSHLSEFYSLSGINEKAKFYKNEELALLYKMKPVDSLKLYNLFSDYQGVLFSAGEKLEKKEVYRIMNFAIRNDHQELLKKCHQLYRSYLAQNDLMSEYSTFYEKDYPQELQWIKENDRVNYLRIKATLFEVHEMVDSALHYLQLSSDLIKNDANKYLVAKFYIRFGQFMERRQNVKNAIEQYETSLTYSEQTRFSPFILEATSRLEDLYFELGNYQEALKYARKNMALKDEINNAAKRDDLLQLEIEKEKELVEMEIEKKELSNQAALSKEKTRKWISIFAGIFLLALALGLWTRIKYVGKVNGLLKSAKIKAEQGERFKQQFLANMSHEIRTPMNAILGMSSLMLETNIDSKQRNYLEAIKSSCENLLTIINDVLDLSKLEAGKMELEKLPFNVKEQVQIVYDTLRFKAEEKGLQCETSIDEEVPKMLVGDSSRLNQILINLCGNAIKFTEKGRVMLIVKKAENSESSLKFIVRDTGIGISADQIENVFSSFQQADLSTSRKYGGTGLGLSISKTLIELQGGNIEVKSEEGKGSEFSFVIPYERYESKEPIEVVAKEVDYKKVLSGIKILVAEDNDFNQIVINDTLIKLIDNVSVEIAPNGKLAIEKLLANDYDVILMDVNMPEMDGHEATIAIRKLESAKKDIPIIALTASVLKAEVLRCTTSGMNAFIPKPFTNQQLVEALTRFYPKV